MDILFYATGECNDSLRDRDFYLIRGCDTETYARAVLQYALLQDGNAGLAEDHGVFLIGDNIQVPDLGYSVQSVTTMAPDTHTEFYEYLNDLSLYYEGGPEYTLTPEEDEEGAFYFGNGEMGVSMQYSESANEVILISCGG